MNFFKFHKEFNASIIEEKEKRIEALERDNRYLRAENERLIEDCARATRTFIDQKARIKRAIRMASRARRKLREYEEKDQPRLPS